MKPDTTTAMHQLIERIRAEFPFDHPQAQLCAGPCTVCSLKLLEHLRSELDTWDERLAGGERPGLAELSGLIRTSRKIAAALHRAGLMPAP
jgi:hypothetical protein